MEDINLILLLDILLLQHQNNFLIKTGVIYTFKLCISPSYFTQLNFNLYIKIHFEKLIYLAALF